MTNKELKTLKDIEEDNLNTLEANIKLEAIKWVKEDIETFSEYYKEIPVFIKRWMKRLNIEEEDLK